jgi:hypothetical protein
MMAEVTNITIKRVGLHRSRRQRHLNNLNPGSMQKWPA